MTGAWALARIPVDIGGDNAREAARQELSKRMYHQDEPGWFARVMQWLYERIRDLLDHLGGGPAAVGYTGLVVLALLAVLLAIAFRLKLGPLARIRAPADVLFTETVRTAEAHRAAAESFAAAGSWAEAIRERLRAVIRELEQRGLLDERPGRTAAEAAAEAGRALPAHLTSLREAARRFDDVWYGGRAATAPMYEQLRGLDEATQTGRPGTARRRR